MVLSRVYVGDMAAMDTLWIERDTVTRKPDGSYQYRLMQSLGTCTQGSLHPPHDCVCFQVLAI
jgi:hypothetical protein